MNTALARMEIKSSTILSNTIVHDGDGSPPYYGGLVIENDVIVDAGPQYAWIDSGIDLEGRSVAPGIIDMHTHSDVSALSDLDCVSAVWQGITTQIVGHCGFSAAPSDEATRRTLVLEEPIFGFPVPDRMNGRIWGWSDIAQYLSTIREARPRTNIGTMVGHNTVRRLVLGSRTREPSPDELGRMVALIEEAIEQGALGVTSGLSYPPGAHAPLYELVAVAAAAGRSGRRYHTHMRYGSTGVSASLREALKTARRANVPVNISHLYPTRSDDPDEVSKLLALIDRAWDAGVDATFDLTLFQRGGGAWSQSLPSWASDGGLEALVERLRHNGVRERLVNSVGRKHVNRDWDDDLIVKVNGAESADLVGRTIGDLAREWTMEPAAAAVVVLEKDAQFWIAPTIKRQSDLDTLLEDARCVPVTDGMAAHPIRHAHLGLMPKTFGTFPLLFGDYVRERRIIDLPDAIARVSSVPADRLGITDRGRVQKGCKADLFIFDPAKIANTAIDDRPGEAPAGITDVMVNGAWAMRDGTLTDERRGESLT